MFAPSLAPTQASGWPIIGHDRAVDLLRRSLRQGQLAHAYLFTGPEGVGKRTLAMALAMTLNCQADREEGATWRDAPCLLCSSCSRTMHGSHPDVVEVSLQTQAAALGETGGKGKSGPAKEIRIDTIREMQATVGLRPHSGQWKVYIIGDADRLNEEAANCMLKTLEEPPGHTIIILLAPDESLVLPTISSRCVHVPLRPLPRSLVARSLVETWGAEPEQAETLSALVGGRLGYAVQLLRDRDGMERRRAALEKVSLLSGATITDRVSAAAEYAKMFTDARSELFDMLDVWELWWRDVLVVKSSAPELAANVDQLPALASVANRVSADRAAETVALLQRTRQQLLENVNPRLPLEALALGMP